MRTTIILTIESKGSIESYKSRYPTYAISYHLRDYTGKIVSSSLSYDVVYRKLMSF